MEVDLVELAGHRGRLVDTPCLDPVTAEVGIPKFMLTSTLPVRFALEFLGADEFHERDVFVANDPYRNPGA
jgi:hypothetical protein